MEKLWNFNRTMDEIVFEGRNKLYGAFELRSHYSQRMARAMLMAVLFFVVLFSAPQIIGLILGRPVVEVVFTADGPIVYMPPPPEIEPPRMKPAAPPAAEAPEVETVRNDPPRVVNEDSQEPESPPPTQEDLSGVVVGNENREGTEGDFVDAPMENNSPGTEPIVTEPAVEKPMLYAEQMPEFPGGLEALYEFISDNVKYSGIARDNRISGKIIVQFVVSKDGDILGAKILSGLGGGLNAQVLAAVNKMPRWKPGKHNGRAVPVTFTLPVKFELKG